MRLSSSRLARIVPALWVAAGAYLASSLARMLPVATVVAADDNGLGSGGASFAVNYVFAVAVVLAFIFGFGIRDAIQRRLMRAKSAKKPTPAPPRA